MDAQVVTQAELSVRTCDRAADVNSIAGLEALHAWSYGLDKAGCVRSRRIWQIGFARIYSGTNICVDGIYACRFDAHQDLPRIRLRLRNILRLQNLGPEAGFRAGL